MFPNSRLTPETLDWLLDQAAMGERVMSSMGTNLGIERVLDVVSRLRLVTPELKARAYREMEEINAEMDAIEKANLPA